MGVVSFANTPDEALAGRIERAAHMVYLDGAREAEVCKALKIKKGTLRDWRRRPEWADAVAEMRERQRELAFDRLAVLTTRAVDAVAATLETGTETNRLKAAIWVLERGNQLVEEAPHRGSEGQVERFVQLVAGDGAGVA